MSARDPWFRIGRLEVTTTILVLFALAASVVAYAIDPPPKEFMVSLALLTSEVSSGEVWRLLTWPFATVDFTLWLLVSAYVFLFSGSDLERETGRRGYIVLLVGAVLAISGATYGAARLFGIEDGIWGFGTLATAWLLLYCAEHPDRPFFFIIRAWMVGVAIVALTIINDIAVRHWDNLFGFLVGMVVIALIARAVGLLTMYGFIPALSMPSRQRAPKETARGTKTTKRRGRRHLSAVPDPPPDEPEPFRPAPADLPPAEATPSASEDELAMDALLDKISAGGLASLTDAERDELEELRQRLSKR